MLTLLLTSLALAQSITLDGGVALQGQAGTFTERGVGAPTVAWEPRQQRFLMFFESQVGDADALCPLGRWSVGLATSRFGYNWDVWPTPIVSPTPGTPWECYAAHPAVAIDDDGSVHLWFKTGRQTDTCAGASPLAACVHPGIAYVSGTANTLSDVDEQIAFFENRLLEIEDEIVAEMDAIEADVAAFKTTLATSAVLECTDVYDAICAPCPSLTLEATKTPSGPGFDTRYLCQAFVLTVPSILPVTSGNAGSGNNRSYIRYWNTPTSTATTCWFKGATTRYDYLANGLCYAPITPHIIQLEVTSGASPTVTAQARLTPTNPQTLHGSAIDTLTAFQGAAASGDITSIYAQADGVYAVLDDLAAFLATQPPSDAVDLLSDDVEAFRASIEARIAQLQALEAEREEVNGYLGDLANYEQNVTFNGGGLALTAMRASYPSVAKVGGTWKMLYQDRRGNLFGATSGNGSSWSAPTQALAKATVSWGSSELFGPSLNCDDDAGPERHVAFYGGRETSTNVAGDPIVVAGFGDASSADFSTWLQSTAAWFTWSNDAQWRHWDMLRTTGGVWRTWTSELQGGKSVIRTGATGSVDNTRSGAGRICD